MEITPPQSPSKKSSKGTQEGRQIFKLSKEQLEKLTYMLPKRYALIRPVDLQKFYSAKQKANKSPKSQKKRTKTQKAPTKTPQKNKKKSMNKNKSNQDEDQFKMQIQIRPKVLRKISDEPQPMQEEIRPSNIFSVLNQPAQKYQRVNRFLKDNEPQTTTFSVKQQSVSERSYSHGRKMKNAGQFYQTMSYCQRASIGRNVVKLSSNDLELLCLNFCALEDEESRGKAIYFNFDFLGLPADKAWAIRNYVAKLLQQSNIEYEEFSDDSDDDFVIKDEEEEEKSTQLLSKQ